jgi:acyl-CoA ligase (AMP-forming) (exosortase A-associated)
MMLPRIPRVLPDLVFHAAERAPDHTALVSGSVRFDYEELAARSRSVASGLAGLGVAKNDRVAVYLPKTCEAVVAMLGASVAGAVFVPINPVLKAEQVAHILADADAKVLVTSAARWNALASSLAECSTLRHVVLVDMANDANVDRQIIPWMTLVGTDPLPMPVRLENDMAALLYTSGSTGRAKGVIVSHRNLVVGATSVASYLENRETDRILSLLPLSFDAGLSQLTTAFHACAQVVLLDYLVPRDAARACEREHITGITGVPPLWMQLVAATWSHDARMNIRYFANTGGKMPSELLRKLRELFPAAKPYLMYGLTEAFRSTYLPPNEVDRIPDSIGKAIPNAEILVVRSDGTECDPGEPGELVHRGPLVTLGYWKDPERTRERFKPAPGQPCGLPEPEIAVWSGDIVTRDADGFLYFVGRNDDMIKTSGYRVSPTEIEEVAFATGLVSEAAAIGVPDDKLGQKIVVIAKPLDVQTRVEDLLAAFRTRLPAFMVPTHVIWRDFLPRNPNGKIDRPLLRGQLLARDDAAQ